MHQLPSVDVFIGLFFFFGVAYGFLFARDKIVAALCSVYIGIVITGSFSGSVYDFFNGNKIIADQLWVKSNASASTIAIVIFLLSIFLVSISINAGSKKTTSSDSAFDILLYSILAVALILSSILGFFPEAVRGHYLEVSRVAKYLYGWHTAFVLAPPIALLVSALQKRK